MTNMTENDQNTAPSGNDTPPPIPPRETKSLSPFSFAFGFMVAALVLLLVIKFAGSPFSHSQKYVVVDSSTIVAQLMTQFNNEAKDGANNEKALDSAKKASLKLHDVFQNYAKQGLIVINQKALLAYPPELDKTSDVAAALGLPLAADKK